MSTAVSDSEIAPGTILAGKYRVERLIGQGGMGVVVEARHTTLDDRVALKFLLPEYSAHPEASQRFLREAKAAVKIKSPHVARVSDVGTLESGAPYMVMEFLEGTDAAHVIERGQGLSVGEAVDYLVQAGDAIAEAHSLGIVHRDIKPANLFVTRHSDGTPFVKVLDFGISKMMGDQGVDGLTRTSATMGSALYMSPEQIKQSKSVDHRTDIYALGVSLYELLTGRQPFIAESFAALCVEIATGAPTPLLELRPDLTPEFAAALEKAYARDLTQRYQTVAEFLVALAPWAPPRSQPIIERVARAAGLVPSFSSAPHADPGRGSYAHLPANAGGMVQTGPSSPGAGVPAATNMSGTTTVPPTTRSPIKPLLVAVGLLIVLGGSAVAAVAVFMNKAPATAESAAPAESTAPVAARAGEPSAVPTLAEPPVEPAVEPSAAPETSASAEPSAAPAPKAPAPTSKVAVAKAATKKIEPKKTETKPSPDPTPAPTPAPTKPKADVSSYR